MKLNKNVSLILDEILCLIKELKRELRSSESTPKGKVVAKKKKKRKLKNKPQI